MSTKQGEVQRVLIAHINDWETLAQTVGEPVPSFERMKITLNPDVTIVPDPDRLKMVWATSLQPPQGGFLFDPDISNMARWTSPQPLPSAGVVALKDFGEGFFFLLINPTEDDDEPFSDEPFLQTFIKSMERQDRAANPFRDQ